MPIALRSSGLGKIIDAAFGFCAGAAGGFLVREVVENFTDALCGTLRRLTQRRTRRLVPYVDFTGSRDAPRKLGTEDANTDNGTRVESCY